jgi:hypothetical protein
VITERKLRALFRDQGFRVLQIRCRKHWVARVERDDGAGRPLIITVARSPSDWRFQHNFAQTLKRAERALTAK